MIPVNLFIPPQNSKILFFCVACRISAEPEAFRAAPCLLCLEVCDRNWSAGTRSRLMETEIEFKLLFKCLSIGWLWNEGNRVLNQMTSNINASLSSQSVTGMSDGTEERCINRPSVAQKSIFLACFERCRVICCLKMPFVLLSTPWLWGHSHDRLPAAL